MGHDGYVFVLDVSPSFSSLPQLVGIAVLLTPPPPPPTNHSERIAPRRSHILVQEYGHYDELLIAGGHSSPCVDGRTLAGANATPHRREWKKQQQQQHAAHVEDFVKTFAGRTNFHGRTRLPLSTLGIIHDQSVGAHRYDELAWLHDRPVEPFVNEYGRARTTTTRRPMETAKTCRTRTIVPWSRQVKGRHLRPSVLIVPRQWQVRRSIDCPSQQDITAQPVGAALDRGFAARADTVPVAARFLGQQDD